MSQRVTVYCDESGNDGPNYLNKDSPFYVLAGWIVPDGSMVDASVAVEAVRQREFQKGATELKYRLFERNDRRRKLLIELFRRLGSLSLAPVYLIAEKRYCVAGKIVETFLDPHYNELARNGMTWNVNVKQEIANTLYECLPDTTLERFAMAYRDPTQKDLEEALGEVEADCRHHVNPELARFFHGSHAFLHEIAADEIEANATWGKGGGTLNLPCLIAFIMMIEELGRSGIFSTKKIVHDEQGAYEDTYKAAFIHCKNPQNFWTTLPGASIGNGSVLTVDSFELQRSVLQPLIQAADVLSGTLNSLCINLIKGNDLTCHDLEVSRYILTPILFHEHRIAFPICSNQMLRRIGDALRKSFPELSSVANPQSHETSDARPLSLLPAQERNPICDSGKPKVSLDLPLFGIVCGSEQRLIAVLYCDPGSATGDDEPVVPLFTTRQLAEEFLAESQSQWEEPHQVRCFDAPELGEFLMQLEEMLEMADTIVINSHGLIKSRTLIEGLRKVKDRMLAAVHTGAINVLLEEHSVEGVNVVSVLLSSGEYGAMKADGGVVHRATTRAEAVKAVIRSFSDDSAT